MAVSGFSHVRAIMVNDERQQSPSVAPAYFFVECNPIVMYSFEHHWYLSFALPQ